MNFRKHHSAPLVETYLNHSKGAIISLSLEIGSYKQNWRAQAVLSNFGHSSFARNIKYLTVYSASMDLSFSNTLFLQSLSLISTTCPFFVYTIDGGFISP